MTKFPRDEAGMLALAMETEITLTGQDSGQGAGIPGAGGEQGRRVGAEQYGDGGFVRRGSEGAGDFPGSFPPAWCLVPSKFTD
uniref:Uncharacterized protein n=1 Tax=Candidatus Kentrum eta TaxID=2126337 RepID=A0A450VEZ6_9GAMM|nr:MAG: hypothetical protein BECKH772A_GA0070896_101268 [Candidatus Kentron sp. H]VFJ98558.1 MAG: hypothetical protein BECKH772B_GA0070898_101375 [Candidatus Kentron sp. H]VFK03301.1 MAG: hypothetical protein BECKH772C_GA0070978_101237 [Candidatus Kentron sp. H]